MGKWKRKLPLLLGASLIMAGTAVWFYPKVSDYLLDYEADAEIADYRYEVGRQKTSELEQLRQEAGQYNALLAGQSNLPEEAAGQSSPPEKNAGQSNPPEKNAGQSSASEVAAGAGNPIEAAAGLSGAARISLADYNDLLAVTDAIGYLEIPKLDVYLPIYHGTGEETLEHGVGHMENSSLPVGGASTHCVLSGHSGLPSGKLLTGLDRMEEGDLFRLHVLDETLAYRVDQLLTVLPDETDAIQIEEGKDYVTLLTCVPYGVNSHRLLVRGVRTEDTPSQQMSLQAKEQEAVKKPGGLSADTLRILAVAGAVLAALLILLILLLL